MEDIFICHLIRGKTWASTWTPAWCKYVDQMLYDAVYRCWPCLVSTSWERVERVSCGAISVIKVRASHTYFPFCALVGQRRSSLIVLNSRVVFYTVCRYIFDLKPTQHHLLFCCWNSQVWPFEIIANPEALLMKWWWALSLDKHCMW